MGVEGDNFNPRTHGECDSSLNIYFLHTLNFNPRTHGECDQALLIDIATTSNFNPRTHGECDLVLLSKSPIQSSISIHALTGSATPQLLQIVSDYMGISIHALTGSATHQIAPQKPLYFYFNPRTHGECDVL